jgi:hypothetical protein
MTDGPDRAHSAAVPKKVPQAGMRGTAFNEFSLAEAGTLLTLGYTKKSSRMNNRISWYAALVMAFAVTLISCKKHDSAQAARNLEKGTWKITFYEDKGNNETVHFNGYSLDFSSSGKVTATAGSVSYSGTWATGLDDNENKLFLDFGAPAPVNELNNDWHIKHQSSTKIELDDISGGNGGTEYLTLEKE